MKNVAITESLGYLLDLKESASQKIFRLAKTKPLTVTRQGYAIPCLKACTQIRLADVARACYFSDRYTLTEARADKLGGKLRIPRFDDSILNSGQKLVIYLGK